ncbi:protein DpdG [Crossiella sp. CA-258035]|uniref:protein DpdG n=1 Tax=Crossiella sp. CA-258035 TaxID=2981138 RepID=UPI0024BD0AEF|nr:protein DpdG [Crossiella sp. CA-258035]WHT23259.1 protein DpdG [Crossiella sp. CA-258035]
MDFLKTHVRASAQALLIICRRLGTRPEGRTTVELQRDLQPELLVRQSSPKESALLPSLKVGEHLGMVTASGGSPEVWSLGPNVDTGLLVDSPERTNAFYAAVLRAIGSTAIADLESGTKPSDVAMGLAWWCALDPYERLPTAWAEAEAVVKAAQMESAIGNSSQWPQFTRWARTLGLVTTTEFSRKPQLAPDCTRALRHALPALPRHAEANQWLHQAQELVPVLSPRLAARLPQPPDTAYVGGSLALALNKLAHIKKIELLATADATSSVVVRLGERDRVVSHIRVLEAT